MNPEDAGELMDQERTRDRFKQRAAITIAILAMLLAITRACRHLGDSQISRSVIHEEPS